MKLSVPETRAAWDGLRNQIKRLEGSVMAIYKSGAGPLGTHEEISKVCTSVVEALEQARSQLETMIIWYDA